MKRFFYVAVIVLGVAALLVLCRRIVSNPDSARRRRFFSIAAEEALAQNLGGSVRERFPGNGELLVIQLPARKGSDESLQQEANRRVLIAFTKALSASSSQVVSVAPAVVSREEQIRFIEGGWGDDLLRCLEAHPKPRAIVSFIGLPADLPAETLRTIGPVLVLGQTGEFAPR